MADLFGWLWLGYLSMNVLFRFWLSVIRKKQISYNLPCYNRSCVLVLHAKLKFSLLFISKVQRGIVEGTILCVSALISVWLLCWGTLSRCRQRTPVNVQKQMNQFIHALKWILLQVIRWFVNTQWLLYWQTAIDRTNYEDTATAQQAKPQLDQSKTHPLA